MTEHYLTRCSACIVHNEPHPLSYFIIHCDSHHPRNTPPLSAVVCWRACGKLRGNLILIKGHHSERQTRWNFLKRKIHFSDLSYQKDLQWTLLHFEKRRSRSKNRKPACQHRVPRITAPPSCEMRCKAEMRGSCPKRNPRFLGSVFSSISYLWCAAKLSTQLVRAPKEPLLLQACSIKKRSLFVSMHTLINMAAL